MGTQEDMLTVYPDSESLSRAAAALFVERARAAVEARGRFVVALAGGSTPERTYRLLAAPPLRGRVPWSGVHVFWGDERCVPAGDPRSNVRLARTALLDHVPVLAANVHPPVCVGTPEQGAARYEAELRRFFAGDAPRFDFILLGLGENGHTASLFPHSPVLDERERWVRAVYVAEQNLHRITFTVPLLNAAAAVVFLVAGEAKAEALHAVLAGPRQPRRLPAQLIEPAAGELRWLVDEAAASRLPRRA